MCDVTGSWVCVCLSLSTQKILEAFIYMCLIQIFKYVTIQKAFVCASYMTVSTKKATPPKSTKSWNLIFMVQIQIKSKSQFEFVPRDIEKCEFLNLLDFWGCTTFSGNCHMGWLQLVGSFKLQVSFARKYRLFYRAFLQKRPIILRSLLIVSTP